MAGKFVLKQRSNGEFSFNLAAGNGETILISEGYSSRDAALVGIEAVRQNAQNARRFEASTSSSGEPYFVLRAANGEVIGTSEMYSSERSRDVGIDAVTATASDATIVDAV